MFPSTPPPDPPRRWLVPVRQPLPAVQGEIEFDDVSFEYNPGAPVLKNVSFNAAAGSTTALVGSSGSGKSTLISLAMNFNQPLSGKIRVDGKDLQSLRPVSYTHLRAHETPEHLVCRLLLEKKKNK